MTPDRPLLSNKASGVGRFPPLRSTPPGYQAFDLAPPMNRGGLTHDDRVDAVAGAVAHFQRAMMMDVDQAAKAPLAEYRWQPIAIT
jgi:hypothetical protein